MIRSRQKNRRVIYIVYCAVAQEQSDNLLFTHSNYK